MNKVAIIFVSLLLLCGLAFGGWFFMNKKSATAFRAQLQKADKMEITYLPTEDDKKTYQKTISYEPQVWLLLGTISDQTPPANCGYMGKIQFFQKGKALFSEPAAFNTAPECRSISFLHDGKIYRKLLLQEGADYLLDLLQDLKKD